MKLCLVVPTRNRPALAIGAARSALADLGSDLSVLISDNSASDEDALALETHCRAAADPRLDYLRPPRELAMPTHWDWAIEQALARTDATHFGIQYDRKLWKRGGLASLWQSRAAHPDILLTYPSDVAWPQGSRFVAGRQAGTGKLYEIACERVIAATARGMIREMGQTFPFLSNCIVPRAAFARIRAAFGDLCDSSTPDAAFAYRFCALETRFHHLDRAAAIVHAWEVSNARSFLTGAAPGGTWDDFLRLRGARPLVAAAPIPDLDLGQNVSFHEYNLVRSTAAGKHFPQIEHGGYLRELSHALPWIEDPSRSAAVRKRLAAHGWRPEPLPSGAPRLRRLLRLPRRCTGAFLRFLGFRRPAEVQTFATDAQTVAFLLANPLPPVSHNPDIAIMGPVEVAPAASADPARAGETT